MNHKYQKPLLGAMLAIFLFLTNSCSYLQKRELTQSRQKWSAQKIVNYRYTIELSAFYPDRGKPVLIQVRDGKQVSLQCVECELREPETFTKLDTIEKIFDSIENGGLNQKYSVDAKYDETLGYPIYWRLVGKPEETDNTFTYKISNFEVIK